jgi:hypothetical protein
MGWEVIAVSTDIYGVGDSDAAIGASTWCTSLRCSVNLVVDLNAKRQIGHTSPP